MTETLEVSRLFIYPLKSAGGIEVVSATVDDRGFEGDRRWLVVDSAGRFLTQRDHPRLALIRPALRGDRLVLRHEDAPDLELPAGGPSGESVRVRIWRDRVEAVDAGEEAARWFSGLLEHPCRLVHMPSGSERQVDPAYARPGDHVSFADGFPFLLVSQESMDELNRRLEAPLGIERFRPNIVVRGSGAPHAEDGWRTVRAGGVAFDVVKPCARCVITTVDPETAAVGREPLRTLARYRTRDGKVCFGQNLIHRSRGTVRVGQSARAELR